MRTLVALVTLGAASLGARVAAASPPEDLVTRPIALDAGQLDAQLVIESSIASGKYASPLSVAPDVWYGVTARWTVGIVHSDPAVDLVDFGASLCVRTNAEEPGACPDVYHGSGLDARYLAWTHGGFAVAPRVRFLVRDLDPWKPAATFGALARWQRGRWSIAADPYLQLGLANTDRGNDSALVVPIYFTLQPACGWALALQTGYTSDLEVWQDGYHIPIGFEVTRARPRTSTSARRPA